MLKVTSWFLVMLEVSIVRGSKTLRSMVLKLAWSQESGTTKPWLRAEKAKSRALVVRNGRALGIFFR
jgi:hypothetical protein